MKIRGDGNQRWPTSDKLQSTDKPGVEKKLKIEKASEVLRRRYVNKK